MVAPDIQHRYTGVEKEEATARYVVNYKDVFSIKYLYLLLHEWFIENGWGTREDHKWPEKFYLQKESPAGKEIWFRWRMRKDFGKEAALKLFRWEIDMDVHVMALKEVEFMHKNKKMTADKGEVEIVVVTNLIIDWEKLWQKHPILSPYKSFIVKVLYRKKKKRFKDDLKEESQRLQDAIKTYLQMVTYMPEKEFGEFWQTRTPE